MGVPDFDEDGNLPAGRHRASPEEVASRLVDPFEESTTRRAIFSWWTEQRRALAEVVGKEPTQWLAGSFCTAKRDPADLDLVTVLDGPSFDDLPRYRRILLHSLVGGHVSEAIWKCDSYPVLRYPDDKASSAPANAAAALWEHHFGHDRNGNDRGFVEVG